MRAARRSGPRIDTTLGMNFDKFSGARFANGRDGALGVVLLFWFSGPERLGEATGVLPLPLRCFRAPIAGIRSAESAAAATWFAKRPCRKHGTARQPGPKRRLAGQALAAAVMGARLFHRNTSPRQSGIGINWSRVMNEDKQPTVHFNNGNKLNVTFPTQIKNSPAAVPKAQARWNRTSWSLEAEGRLLVIPWRVCSRWKSHRAVALPFGVIKGARVRSTNVKLAGLYPHAIQPVRPALAGGLVMACQWGNGRGCWGRSRVPTATTNAPSKLFPEDGWLDVSGFLDTAYGFIPLLFPSPNLPWAAGWQVVDLH